MIKLLKNSGRFNITVALVMMTLFCFFLSVFRYYFSETKVFLFLNWNLFLAFIPWAVSTVICLNRNLRTNKIALTLLLFTWLLFFPNSPYILTDLFHLHSRGSVPIWFDLIIIISFAWTGLSFGFISLINIENLISKYLKKNAVRITMIILLFAGSFGVYLGRYLRWNSWDIIDEPYSLLSQIGERFINPMSYPGAWGMTILMGVLLNMMFWTIRLFSYGEKVIIE